MKKRLRNAFVGTAGALTIAVFISACGRTFNGTVAVKGNMPFTYLVLATDTGDLKIVGANERKLRDCCQGMRVTVRGTIVNKGAGFFQPPELEITEIVSGE